MKTPAVAWARLTVAEAKMLWRDPISIIIPVGLPLAIMVLNGAATDGAGPEELSLFPGFDAFVVPFTLSLIVGFIGVTNVPGFLAEHRKSGVLRRLAVTPAHPTMLLVAQLLVSLALTMAGLALALGVARIAFDLSAPDNLPGALVAFTLGLAAMFALGLAIAALAPSPNASNTIGLVAILGMAGVSGLFGTVEALPDWLATLGSYLPFGATFTTLSDAWTGASPDPGRLLALVAATVLSAAVAVKFFRWE